MSYRNLTKNMIGEELYNEWLAKHRRMLTPEEAKDALAKGERVQVLFTPPEPEITIVEKIEESSDGGHIVPKFHDENIPLSSVIGYCKTEITLVDFLKMKKTEAA